MNTSTFTNMKQLLPLYAVIFLGFFGYALTIALFIPMIMDSKMHFLPLHSSVTSRASISGFLLAMYPLGQFIGSPIIGNLSDHFGRKKILMLSLTACVFGFTGIALSIEFNSLPFLFISAFLTGLCESNMAISQSVIADTITDSIQKTKYIGYAYSACSFGYIIGPIVGGFGGVLFGYSSAFWITALGVLLLLVWLSFCFKEKNQYKKSKPICIAKSIFSIKSIFDDSKLLKIYIVNFLIFFAIQGLYRVVPIYVVNKWHPTLQSYTLLIAFVSFMCLIANLFFMGYLAKYFSTQKLLRGLLLIGGFIVLTIILPNHYFGLWIIYGVAVIPTVMALTTATTWLSNSVKSEEQGKALGNNQALLVLGEASSAAIGGLIAMISIPLPIVVMGGILLLSTVFINKKYVRLASN